MSVKSLQAQGSKIAKTEYQLSVLNSLPNVNFPKVLAEHNQFPLEAGKLEILQVNVGYMCNQTCEHCHVDAGPDRKEIMTKQTMNYCLDVIDKSGIKTVDITGGAPEMNPNFIWFVEELSRRNLEIIVRSNLTILVSNKRFRSYPEFFKKHNVTVIASLPCYTEENTDNQRGKGVFNDSIEALKQLNEVGFGKDSKLKLHLVYNPGGAFLPGNQSILEKDYKQQLKKHFDITFNSLYALTNLPISRFLDYLLAVNKLESYMSTLVNAFNLDNVPGLMCRNTLSVGYNGELFDCDFNQMLQLKVQGKNNHIANFNLAEFERRNIVVHNHCFGCTAGSGSSCQGVLS